MCAAYISNRLTLKCLNNMSPYQNFFCKAPNNDHLRAFGCLCFVSTLKHGRPQFATRANTCVFLGYPYAQKAYKVYDLNTKQFIVTRDIIFHEKHFPFHQKILNPIPFFHFLFTVMYYP